MSWSDICAYIEVQEEEVMDARGPEKVWDGEHASNQETGGGEDRGGKKE